MNSSLSANEVDDRGVEEQRRDDYDPEIQTAQESSAVTHARTLRVCAPLSEPDSLIARPRDFSAAKNKMPVMRQICRLLFLVSETFTIGAAILGFGGVSPEVLLGSFVYAPILFLPVISLALAAGYEDRLLALAGFATCVVVLITLVWRLAPTFVPGC